MAYGKKFEITNVQTATRGSLGGNTTWIVEIYQDGYAGAVADLIGTGNMLEFSWTPTKEGIFFPLMPSELVVNIRSETEGQYNQFRSADISEYYCVIKKNGVDFWSGSYRAETYTEQYISTPYVVSLSFNCGLADLQFFEYDDAGALFNGDEDVLTIILTCLNKIQPNRNVVEIINLLEDSFTTGTSDGMLDQSFLTQGFFTEPDVDGSSKGISCYKVLEGIMDSLLATLMQWDNKWWIIRTEELLGSTYWHIEVDPAGLVAQFGGLVSFHGNFNNPSGIGDPFTWADQDQSLNTREAYNRIKYAYRYMGSTRIGSNLITNSEFTTGITNWLAEDPPQPRYWTQSAALSALSGAIEFGSRGGKDGMVWTNTAIVSALDVNLDKFLTAIEDTETDRTQRILYLNNTDKFIIAFKGEITKQFDSGVSATVSVPLGMAYEVEFKFYLKISASDYLRGDNKTGLTWGSSGTFSIFVPAPSQELSQTFTVDVFDIIQETPTIPASGKNVIYFNMFIPVTHNFVNSIGGPLINTDNVWMDYVRLEHLPADKAHADIKEIGKITDDVQIRSNPLSDNILNITVKHGDGPMETAMGSFRKSDGSVTSSWHKRGLGTSKPLEEIAIFDVVERFLGGERKQISGTIISTTSLSLVRRFDEKTDGGVYKIISMRYTPITNGGDKYVITIEELINASNNWQEENLDTGIYKKGDKGIGLNPIDYFKGGLEWFVSGGGGIGTVGAKTVEVGEIGEVTVLGGGKSAMLPNGDTDLLGSWNWQSADVSDTSDFSQNGNHSITQTGITTTSGDIGLSAVFNGSFSKIDTPNLNNIEGTNSLTLFAKFNKDLNKDQMIAGQDQAIRLRGLAGGKIQGSVYISGAWHDVDSVATVSTAVYHTAAVIYDGVNIELFIDGVSDNTVAQTGNTPASTKLFTIGYLEGGSEFFDGKIEQVSIFKTDLTSDNIDALNADPLGELHTTDLVHGYAVGDIIASNQYDIPNQTQYVITHVPTTTTYRAYPATTNRTVLRSFFRKYGNVFDTDRQGTIIWDLDNDGQPQFIAKSPMTSFPDLTDTSLQTFNLSPEGIVKMLLAIGGKMQCSHGLATIEFDIADGISPHNITMTTDNGGFGEGYLLVGDSANYFGHAGIGGAADSALWMGSNYPPFTSQDYIGFYTNTGGTKHDWLWMVYNGSSDFNTIAIDAYPVLISVGEGVTRQNVIQSWVAGTIDYDLDADKTGIVGNIHLNPDKATAGLQLQDSPIFRLMAKYWTGAASEIVKFDIYIEITATTPTYDLVIENNSGVKVLKFDQDGVLTIPDLASGGGSKMVVADVNGLLSVGNITSNTNTQVICISSDTSLVSVSSAIYITIFSFHVNAAGFNSSTGDLSFLPVIANRNMSVKLRDVTNSQDLGELVNIGPAPLVQYSPGPKTFSLTNIPTTGLVQIDVMALKVLIGGQKPQVGNFSMNVY